MFGTYTNQSSEFYSDLLIILQQVSEASDFKKSVPYEAQKLSENLRKFQTILTAFTMIRIFGNAKPVSDYLQTSGSDIMHPWRMINKATENVEKIARDFSGLFKTVHELLVASQQFSRRSPIKRDLPPASKYNRKICSK